MSQALILQCSPRPQGNSAYAAQLVRDIIENRCREEHSGKELPEEKHEEKHIDEPYCSEKNSGEGRKEAGDSGRSDSHQPHNNPADNNPADNNQADNNPADNNQADNNQKDNDLANSDLPNSNQAPDRQVPGSSSSGEESSVPAGQGAASSPVHILRLCDYVFSPCIGCGICSIPKSHKSFFLGCPLSKHDESETVLGALLQASTLFFISPIYHYHLPAQAKAVLDRLQPFYWMQMGKIPYPHNFRQDRHQVSILVAGQPRGEKLFAGSLLSLRYSLRSIGYVSEDNLGLRGLDAKNDLRETPEAQALIAGIVHRTLNRQAAGLSSDKAP